MSSSAVPFSCLQYFPASGPFPMSQFFESVRHSIGASASVFPMHIQDWSPLGLTCLISLEAKLHLYWINYTGNGVLNMRMKTFFSSTIPIIYIFYSWLSVSSLVKLEKKNAIKDNFTSYKGLDKFILSHNEVCYNDYTTFLKTRYANVLKKVMGKVAIVLERQINDVILWDIFNTHIYDNVNELN